MNDNKKNLMGFIVSIVVFLGFFASCIFGLGRIHLSYRRILNDSIKSMSVLQEAIKEVYSIETEVDNAIVYGIASNDAQSLEEYANKVYYSLMSLEDILYDYSEYDMNALEQSRYNLLIGYTKNYESILTKLRGLAESSDYDGINQVYTHEFKPNCIAVREILESLISVDSEFINNKRTLIVTGVRYECMNVIIEGVAILIGFIVINAIRIRNAKKLQKALKSNAKAKESLSQMVYTDVLTELSNRSALMNRFDAGFKLNDNQTLYATMFNINGFSQINTNYGSRLGDVVLVEFANRLRNCFNKSEVYRINGDEFIVLTVTNSGVVGYNNYLSVLTNARNSLMQEYSIESTSITINHSVSLVKKTGQTTVDFTVIDVLKEALDRGRLSQTDSVSFIDLDVINEFNKR